MKKSNYIWCGVTMAGMHLDHVRKKHEVLFFVDNAKN